MNYRQACSTHIGKHLAFYYYPRYEHIIVWGGPITDPHYEGPDRSFSTYVEDTYGEMGWMTRYEKAICVSYEEISKRE